MGSFISRASIVALLAVASLTAFLSPGAAGASAPRATPSPTPSPVPAVIQVQVMSLNTAAGIVHQLFPKVRVRTDPGANAIVVVGSPDDVQTVRTVISGLDVRNPNQPALEVVQLHTIKPDALVHKVAPLFPNASITVASKNSVLLKAKPLDGTQVKALIASLDAAPTVSPSPPPDPVEAIDIKLAQPAYVARAVVRTVPHVRISVSGSSLLITGDQQTVAAAKTLVAQLDVPPAGSTFTEVYHLKSVDAGSVGALVQKTYPDTTVAIDTDLNAISVRANASEQTRINDAIEQLDGKGGTPGMMGQPGGGAAMSDGNMAVIQIKSAIPGVNGAASTTAQDIATAVTQALGQMASGLHVTVMQSASELILTGDPSSIRLAKELIAKLDVVPPLVELDTEVLEIDGSLAKNLGLELPTAVISTTFEEIQPTPDPYGNPGRIGKIQPITRTPLQLTAELNLLIQHGDGRVLADPRIVTLSGHDANFQAGDTLSILTTTGGGVGTVVTTQLQSFNTGVTLDITPIVNPDGNIIVTVHPTVNSLSGDPNGVPEISTRNAQTTVTLHDNQTLVIGGLIQLEDTRTITSLPVLGNIPIIGGLFKNNETNNTSNELVIVVTPHIIRDGEPTPPPGATMGLPTPQALPTVPPGMALPTVRPSGMPTQGPLPVLNTPPPSSSPAPQPTPSAFAASNVFEYGHAPMNNFAQPQDAPQIFYARLAPTVMTPSTTVSLDVITTTNCSRVQIGTPSASVSLNAVGPGKWQGTFPASQLGLGPAQPVQQLTLNAYRNDGFSATVQIPVSSH
ncbi:MAG TPA: secretin N-terminal domain-containing protein [Candidatus Acidoferrum sp.]|jgi:type II secretory pathway component GspD/PulD (secretin)|nr:secretin N-terminal domain-containing protein [Candidatus Acidoferrum sp.]